VRRNKQTHKQTDAAENILYYAMPVGTTIYEFNDARIHTPLLLYGPFFLGSPEWAGARRELLDFMVQWKTNRGRHTNHPAGHHTIWT